MTNAENLSKEEQNLIRLYRELKKEHPHENLCISPQFALIGFDIKTRKSCLMRNGGKE